MNDELDDWITTAEGARLTGYTAEMVRVLAHNGTVKARKMGSFWLVSRTALLAYQEAQQEKGQKRGPKPKD